MPDRHALLGPSSSERWLSCPPSARLEEQFPNTTSVYAEEGTLAHSYAERKLNALIAGETLHRDATVSDEMWDCTEEYRDFVEEEYNEAKAKTKDARLLVEQELDFGDYVPEGFGTSDAVIVSDNVLEVIDFKYGKGVPVSAEENSQLRLYALGAYLALSPLYDFDTVKMAIFQPRINYITTDSVSVDGLLEWADNYVRPRAEMAFNGEGEFCVGEHCRFCRASAVCRARAEVAFGVVETANQDVVLTDEEIADVLDKLDTTEERIASIRTYVQDKAINDGVKWPGYKLVESRTQRKITDSIKALSLLETEGFDRDDVTTLKLKGITELEKIVGKKRFNELLGELVVKPQGQPTLVRDTDRRPEINPIELAFKEN